MTTQTRCDNCSKDVGDTGMQLVIKAGVFKMKRQVFDVCDLSCLQDLCQKISVGDVEVSI